MQAIFSSDCIEQIILEQKSLPIQNDSSLRIISIVPL